MSKSIFVWGGVALILLSMAGFAGWVLSLPAATAGMEAPPVPREEANAMLASLRPTKRERPLVAIIGLNDATETTDYIVPAGILRRADVADVTMLAAASGPVQLFPALQVEPDATIAAFDAAHPEGADYVIVPAMSRDDDPAVIAWLRDQAQKGAKIIGICAGAKVVAAAGLLNGKRATTHWYYLDEMLKRDQTIDYVANRRLVSDEGVTTTTGVTASMPMMLTLIEAMAGRAKAEAVAHDLGLERWDSRHASGAFRLTRPFAMTVLANRLAFWNREEFGVSLEPGMDEVSLAFVADAWSRTYRSHATTHAAAPDSVESRNGVRIIPDRTGTNWPEDRRVSTFSGGKPAEVLDQTLEAIAVRYGEATTNVVTMQLEYPGPAPEK
ncbi:DJ-1/PfpI family protein [Pseudaminobacter salicylatoxidans]|uniref:DJ-1/PfpI family protein n=1 Tax=Pseudaminobacter salicylatoxidans TaxID=93369 RepID=A0A316C9M5_PSESE|nr:DJ-1/PfpI family protein [Pseudaminobacter salicylatoxidans]PWJ86512.1 DJ-1/PfpI family protein [Pseudaminobacter salicylatoxidans]